MWTMYFLRVMHYQNSVLRIGSVSSRECLDAPAILATFTAGRTGNATKPVRPAVKVARIAGASRHSRLETEPILYTALLLSEFHISAMQISFNLMRI